MAKLPLIQLPDCPHCHMSEQGTRAKGGNSVRCIGCGTMRRVPMDRRMTGPDDPRANVPVRGRPLEPGHPWRFQPSNQAGPRRPASSKPARSSSTARKVSAAVQQAKTARLAPAMDTFREIIQRLNDRPDVPLQLTTETGDGTDCYGVVQLAGKFDSKYPKFGLYWEASKNWKSVKFWIDRSEYQPRFTTPRENVAQPSRVMPNQVRPAVVSKATYVNPDTCPHPGLSYDHMADAYRCPDCSYARPAWT